MPQPERLIPDFKKDLVELADAQDVKVETQKSRFAELACAQQKMDKEAEDVLRIAHENSSDPAGFILDGIKEYAEDEGVSFLAACALVLQHVSPEWKEAVDKRVREYFEDFDFSEFVRLPEGSEEVETLKILCDEGYLPLFVIAVHYPDDFDGREGFFDELFLSLKVLTPMIKGSKEKSFDEKESCVLDPVRIFPEAKEYLEKMKENGPIEEYEYVINLAYMHVVLSVMIKHYFPGFDCDERTLLFQKFAMDGGLEGGNYMKTRGHVVLRLDGLPLVFDTFDMKIRTIEECARREGYGSDEERHGSYFWRDEDGEYLAQYDDSGSYPRRIVGYERVKKSPNLVTGNDYIANLLIETANDLNSEGEIEEAILYYKQVLNIKPGSIGAHLNLANLLKDKGDVDGATLYYKKALQLNPNYVETLNNFANLLKDEGDADKAILYYKKALKIDPNNVGILRNLAVLLEDKGDELRAIGNLERVVKIDPNDSTTHFKLMRFWVGKEAFSKAIFHCEKALKIDPDNANYRDFLRKMSYVYLLEQFTNLKYDFNGLGDSGWESRNKFAKEVIYICSHRKKSVLDIKWEEIFPKGGDVDYEGGSVAYDQGRVNLEVLGKVENWIRNNLS